jgi:uncharacterized protein (TIGR02246 family)
MTGTATDTTVRDTILATVAAWDASDADAFAALYTPDATVVLAGGTFLRGREEIRGYMTAGFAGPLRGTRGGDEQESVRVLGDAAVVVSRSGYALPGEDGPAPERLRRATWTLARHDGRWFVEAYHNCPL